MSSIFDNADREPDYVVRTGTERVVHDLLRALHGPHAVASKPISPELSIPHPVPADWGQGIAAARWVAARANSLVHEYAKKARGDGVPWRNLADPLGIEVDAWEDPAAAAFEHVAGTPVRTFDTLTVLWRCGSCGQLVTDRGPYNGHPVNNETGHAETCARHQAEIDAYMARIDD